MITLTTQGVIAHSQGYGGSGRCKHTQCEAKQSFKSKYGAGGCFDPYTSEAHTVLC